MRAKFPFSRGFVAAGPTRLSSPASVLVGVLLGALPGLLSGCFGDTPQPSAHRFACDAQADCNDSESCISGLCQVPCSFATFETDCPQGGGYASCFNGVCSHSCSLSQDDLCPNPQSCIGLDLGEDAGGDFGGVDLSDFGVCGETCDSDDPASCPEGEACFEGLCVPLGGGGETGGEETGGDGTGTGDTGTEETGA